MISEGKDLAIGISQVIASATSDQRDGLPLNDLNT